MPLRNLLVYKFEIWSLVLPNQKHMPNIEAEIKKITSAYCPYHYREIKISFQTRLQLRCHLKGLWLISKAVHIFQVKFRHTQNSNSNITKIPRYGGCPMQCTPAKQVWLKTFAVFRWTWTNNLGSLKNCEKCKCCILIASFCLKKFKPGAFIILRLQCHQHHTRLEWKHRREKARHWSDSNI